MITSKQAVEIVQWLYDEQGDQFSALHGMYADAEIDALRHLIYGPVGYKDRATLCAMSKRLDRAHCGERFTLPEILQAIESLLRSTRRLKAVR